MQQTGQQKNESLHAAGGGGNLRVRFQHGPGRANILGARIDLLNYAQTIARMERAIRQHENISVGFVNVYTIMRAREDPAIRQALAQLTLTVPDGMPLVWLSRLTDTPLRCRVYGPDLFSMFCDLSQAPGYRHFFFGSTPQVLARLTDRLLARFPDLQIAGTLSPPFREPSAAEEAEMVATINAARADVLWVALGSPRQEVWVARMRARLHPPVIAAVGAAFDFHAGTLKQAPRAWQDRGFEWLYRLIQEPRRLAKRYLLYNPLFVAAVARQALAGRAPGGRSALPQPADRRARELRARVAAQKQRLAARKNRRDDHRERGKR